MFILTLILALALINNINHSGYTQAQAVDKTSPVVSQTLPYPEHNSNPSLNQLPQ